MISHLDVILFIAFLLLNLVVGLHHSGGVKTLKDYAVGRRNFSVATLTATIVATWMSGSAFDIYIPNIYSEGLFYIIRAFGSVLALLMVSKLASRMGEFLGKLSIAEALGSLYGIRVRIITACSGSIMFIGAIAAQIKLSAQLMKILLGLQAFEATLLATATVILYATLGGIRSVTFTDVAQFIVFIVSIPILFVFISRKLILSDVIKHFQGNPKLSLISLIEDRSRLVGCLSATSYVCLAGLNPSMFQRVIIAKNTYQVKKSFAYASLVYFFITVTLIGISLLMMVKAPSLPKKELLPHMIACMPTFFRGLFIIGVLAMIMSTTDSYANATSILLTNDVISCFVKLKKPVFFARITTVLVGFVSLVFALNDFSILTIIYLASSFYMPLVTMPLILAILGFRTTEKSVVIGMLAGLLVSILWIYNPPIKEVNSVFPGIVANVVFLLGSHYILKQQGGWVGIQDNVPLVAEKQQRQRAWRLFRDSFKGFTLSSYIQNIMPKAAHVYVLFGLYSMLTTYIGLFFFAKEAALAHNVLHNYVLYSLTMLNFLFLTYPSWSHKLQSKRFMSYLWTLSVFYILFFVGSLFVLISKFHFIYMLIWMFNLVVSAFLFPDLLVLIMGLLGPLLAYSAFVITLGESIAFTPITVTQTQILYALFLIGGFLVVLFIQKQATQKLVQDYIDLNKIQKATENALIHLKSSPDRFVKRLYRGGDLAFSSAYQQGVALVNAIEKMPNKQLQKSLLTQAKQLTQKIGNSAKYIEKVIYLIQNQDGLHKQQKPLNDFLHDVLTQLDRLPSYTPTVLNNQAQQITVAWDMNKLAFVLIQAFQHIQKSHPNTHHVRFDIHHTHLLYPGGKKQVPAIALCMSTANDIPSIQKSYKYWDKPLEYPWRSFSWYINEVKKVVYLHYGYLNITPSIDTILLVLPRNVGDIRPKMVEDDPKLYMPLTNEVKLNAKLVEANFWRKVAKHTYYDCDILEQAVAFMKTTHKYQKRKSGDLYYTHPLQVAMYVTEETNSQTAVIGALLHDTVEDTQAFLEEIEHKFGEEVRILVMLLSNVNTFSRKYNIDDEKDKINKLFTQKNKEAILIKLCDRRHNMETIASMPLHKQRKKAEETLRVYVPYAESLGYIKLAQRLKELCSKVA